MAHHAAVGMPEEAPSMAEYRFTPEDRGVHVYKDIVLNRIGINRVFAMDEVSGLFARSNPGRTTAQKTQYGVYWGETHCHSCMSDDSSAMNDLIPRPSGDYEYARDRSGLDFCMVTDHVEDLSDEEWEETKKTAAEYYEPGRFVTFSAFEATFQPSRKNGDKNVYFMEDNERRVFSGTTEDLYQDLKKRITRVMVIPHLHVPTNWDRHEPELERVVEVYSHWDCGVSPESTPPFIPGDGRPEKHYVSHALEQGAKIGFIGSADHSLGPSRRRFLVAAEQPQRGARCRLRPVAYAGGGLGRSVEPAHLRHDPGKDSAGVRYRRQHHGRRYLRA